jgi:hypothetical protein
MVHFALVRIFTDSASSVPGFLRHDQIGAFKRVTILTVRLTHAVSDPPFPTFQVLALSNNFQMVRIHAASYPALVIQYHIFWYWASQEFKYDSVSTVYYASDINASIPSFVARPRP